MSHVCFAAAVEFNSCVTSCRNAAAVLGGTWAVIPRGDEPPAVTLESDLLVLSSWHDRYTTIFERRRRPIVLRWHSTILQSEIEQEALKVARIVDLLDAGAIPALAVSDPDLASLAGRESVVHLPEVLAEGGYDGVKPAQLAGVNISLFGDAPWRKNIFVQSAAFDRARRRAGASDWTLHVNGLTAADEEYGDWLRAARIPFVDHGWLERSQYLSLVSAMDVGLCATLCGTYGYGAADHVALGVPVIASRAIGCLGTGLTPTRPDLVDEIAGALQYALVDRETVAGQQRRSLDEAARANTGIARRAFAEIASRAGLAASPIRPAWAPRSSGDPVGELG
jgi:glycosyltransferase involved in cell wall biosynthesis